MSFLDPGFPAMGEEGFMEVDSMFFGGFVSLSL